MSSNVTERQQEILTFIAQHVAEKGGPPTTRQMALHFGYTSEGSIRSILKILTEKGYATAVHKMHDAKRALRWSDSEKAILSNHYSTLGAAGCCPLIPRMTQTQIRHKADCMGLSEFVRLTDAERFNSKFYITPGCWIWTGGRFSSGYGQFAAAGKNWSAHRYSYTQFIGPIPDDLCVCHRCDTPLCVNPNHFFLGTTQENTADRVAKGRTTRQLGEKNKVSKLTNADVREIRAALGNQEEIGRRFGVSGSNVCMIKSRKSWAHLPDRDAECAE